MERRGIGKEGTLVALPQVKHGSPSMNLPDLEQSRQTRNSPITKQTLGVMVAPPDVNLAASEKSNSRRTHHGRAGNTRFESELTSRTSVLVQQGPGCADCDPSGGGGAGASSPSDPYFGTARIRRLNRTGVADVTLGSRNFNWSLPLVSLPGRAALDVSISLYYNSLVWTRQGNLIEYNADHGTPAPGFQLGLPRLQAQFFNIDNTGSRQLARHSGHWVSQKRCSRSMTA